MADIDISRPLDVCPVRPPTTDGDDHNSVDGRNRREHVARKYHLRGYRLQKAVPPIEELLDDGFLGVQDPLIIIRALVD